MPHPTIDPVLPPTYDAVIPNFKVLLSSQNKDWQNVQVFRYDIQGQPELIAPPITEAHVLKICIEGKSLYELFQEGKLERKLIYPGELSLTPSGMPSTSRWTQRFVADSIFLSPILVHTLAADLSHRGSERVELISKPYFRDPLTEQLCLALARELEPTSLYGNLYAETLTQALILHLLQHHSTLSNRQRILSRGLSRKQLQLVVDFINDRLAYDVTLRELASLVGVSQAHFVRQFKRSTGLPPHQYLVHLRVERAKELLLTSQLTIAEVAYAVGFYDQSHLNRHFKRILNVLPKDVKDSKWLSRQSKNIQL